MKVVFEHTPGAFYDYQATIYHNGVKYTYKMDSLRALKRKVRKRVKALKSIDRMNTQHADSGN